MVFGAVWQYLLFMELAYPINLIGIDDGAVAGDVLTRDGEYLGRWEFIKNEEQDTGLLQFICDGEGTPMFSEEVGVLSSGMLTGLAMSKLCGSIRDWHEEQDRS